MIKSQNQINLIDFLNFKNQIKSNQTKKITNDLVIVDLVQFLWFIQFESNNFFEYVCISTDTNINYMSNLQKSQCQFSQAIKQKLKNRLEFEIVILGLKCWT